ncbi:hypothetical protein [Bacillus solimangrovi]|nr:hypothetical protein [Bacillus solimangrovi]
MERKQCPLKVGKESYGDKAIEVVFKDAFSPYFTKEVTTSKT